MFYADESVDGVKPGKYTKTRTWARLQAVLKANGLPGNRVHAFRHSFCSAMANRGVSPFIVMRIIGHGSLDIVMQYYHLSDTEMVSALSSVSFDDMMREPQPVSASTPPSAEEAA